MLSIDWDEYSFFNRVVVIIILALIVFSWILDLNELYQCNQLSITGMECSSCGVTRDFISYIHFDFSNHINQHSLGLFIYFLFQIVFRLFYGFMKSNVKMRKQIIYIFDLLLTLVGGCLAIGPFWF